MIDREKVIKGLECCSAMSGDECSKCPYGAKCRDTDLPYGMPHLASDALALLKEQDPKTEVLSDGDTYYSCPTCDISIYKNQRYCDRCGQKIRWNDEKSSS